MKKILMIFSALLLLAACGNDEPDIKRVKPEYVDLGLSVKWATFNLDAMEQANYGGLFGWADTTGTHKGLEGIELEFNDYEGTVICKWSSQHYGGLSPMSDISGKACDVATYKWGTGWRIPTRKEMQDLIDLCTWKPTTMGTVEGYLVTGPSGKSIFMPMAGLRTDGKNIYSRNKVMAYWSSTLATGVEQSAAGITSNVVCSAHALKLENGSVSMKPEIRGYGLSVRPVHN